MRVALIIWTSVKLALPHREAHFKTSTFVLGSKARTSPSKAFLCREVVCWDDAGPFKPLWDVLLGCSITHLTVDPIGQRSKPFTETEDPEGEPTPDAGPLLIELEPDLVAWEDDELLVPVGELRSCPDTIRSP